MENKNITALVLRFRDKGEDVTDTIDTHQKIIEQYKYVWWGWWAKDYEKSPLDYFEYIHSKINSSRSKSFPVFLLHTKKKRVFKAKCVELRYSSNGGSDVISSPEIDKTPSYYNSTKVKLWLKFTQIKECDFSYMQNTYSFDKDPSEFFEDLEDDGNDKKNNLYIAFDGCKVSSIDDFLVQKRTLWFLRNQKKMDGPTPVQEWKPLQDNFASNYVKTPYTKLLLLSDLHFSLNHTEKHNFALRQDDPENTTLLSSIMSIIQDEKIEVGGILISGDLTFKPCEEDFNLAAEFIEELVSQLNLKTSQVAIVPGNHDISFDPTRQDDENIVFASDASKKAYRTFYKKFFHVEPNEFLCGSKRLILGNGLPLEIICANSSVLQQEEDLFVQGMIGRQQLQLMINHMDLKKNIKTYTYRIFLMHHHLVAANYMKTPEKKKRYSALLDSGQVQRFLTDYDVNLVIHGHEHENIGISLSSHLSKNSNKVEIIGLGSAGSSDLCKNVNNSFGILDFDEFGKVKYIKYDIVPNGNTDSNSKTEYSFTLH